MSYQIWLRVRLFSFLQNLKKCLLGSSYKSPKKAFDSAINTFSDVYTYQPSMTHFKIGSAIELMYLKLWRDECSSYYLCRLYLINRAIHIAYRTILVLNTRQIYIQQCWILCLMPFCDVICTLMSQDMRILTLQAILSNRMSAGD